MRAPARLSYGRIPNLVELKDLIATQLESFQWFKTEGLRELFDEINPITDYTGKNFELKFLDYEFGQPKFSVEECRNRDMTYAAPLRIKTRLTIKETGEIKESEVYMGDFAMMTDEGTFIVNGTERVVVSQLVRSPGVYFTAAEDPNTGRKLFGAKLIPNRGAWLEIETSAKDLLTVKIDRKRKVPVTVLLKALELPQLKGTENDREAQKRGLMEMFGDVDNNPEHRYMESTLDKDTTNKTEDALLELYRRVRPGDPPSVDNARNLLQSLFFNPRRLSTL
jgi:DNA-directed RNA polymerase subunit beta